MKFLRKILVISILLMIIFNISFVDASFKINSANLYSKGRCETLFIDRSINAPIIVTKVFYNDGNGDYPAYCLNRELLGVGEIGEFSVSVDEAISNVLVWRVITNGYPYKSFAELGVANEDEAYTATKQALYCILYGFDEGDFWKYEPVGEEGERTLNAMKQIVYRARNSSDSPVSSNIEISEKDSLWKIDINDRDYISKEFTVSAGANLKNYSLTMSGDIIDGTKIVDLSNNEKNTFNSNENFKILIPIRGLEKSGNINLRVNGEVATKPVLYGNSNNADIQNYALTGSVFEIGNGALDIKYNKNTSKLIIKKQDTNSEEFLTGAEFRISDKDSNVIYDGVNVNEKGIAIIDGILPGDYFLEEIKAPNGYDKYEGKIDFSVSLNDEVELVVNNSKKPVEEKKIEKLPKTGM